MIIAIVFLVFLIILFAVNLCSTVLIEKGLRFRHGLIGVFALSVVALLFRHPILIGLWAAILIGYISALFTVKKRAKYSQHKKTKKENTEKKIIREKVIERQVLVFRCTYCHSIVPIEAQKCSNCGAIPQ